MIRESCRSDTFSPSGPRGGMSPKPDIPVSASAFSSISNGCGYVWQRHSRAGSDLPTTVPLRATSTPKAVVGVATSGRSLCSSRDLIAREQCWSRCRGFSWTSRLMGLACLSQSSSAPFIFRPRHQDLQLLNLPTPKAPAPSIFFSRRFPCRTVGSAALRPYPYAGHWICRHDPRHVDSAVPRS
jgi:hypothetical protein